MYNDMHRPNEHSIISLYICLCPISHACAECKLPVGCAQNALDVVVASDGGLQSVIHPVPL